MMFKAKQIEKRPFPKIGGIYVNLRSCRKMRVKLLQKERDTVLLDAALYRKPTHSLVHISYDMHFW